MPKCKSSTSTAHLLDLMCWAHVEHPYINFVKLFNTIKVWTAFFRDIKFAIHHYMNKNTNPLGTKNQTMAGPAKEGNCKYQ